jgi:hypothetical protein
MLNAVGEWKIVAGLEASRVEWYVRAGFDRPAPVPRESSLAMTISSRTPEGNPNVCPICGHAARVEPSTMPTRDAPCPQCGHLLWFDAADGAPDRVLARTPVVQKWDLEASVLAAGNRWFGEIAAELVGPLREALRTSVVQRRLRRTREVESLVTAAEDWVELTDHLRKMGELPARRRRARSIVDFIRRRVVRR